MPRYHSDDSDAWLVGTPPTPLQTRLALAAAVIPVIALAVLAPFASIRLAQIDSFIPAFEGTIFVTDLLTSVLLFSQFSIYRSRALLVLACGFLFSAVTLVAHGLTFPGAFSPGGLLGAGLQSTAWIYWSWHFGFPLSLLTYGLLKDEKPAKRLPDVPAPFVIGGSTALVIAFACALILLATAGNDFMPRLALDRVDIAPLNQAVGSASMLLCASALAVLWVRRRSVLDQWLMVVAVAALCELGLAVIFVGGRYTIGFYAGRIFTFLTSTIVLVVLLVETTRLYARLARTNAELERERDSKMLSIRAATSSIVQPLTGIVANSAAARRWLQRAPPDVGEAVQLLGRIESATLRANEVLENVRKLFQDADHNPEPIDVNTLALGALQILDKDLSDHRIRVDTELGTELPPVMGHRGQLQEVILNLVHNAIDAMASVEAWRRALRLRTRPDGGKAIVIEVEDSGQGIEPKRLGSIFEAFVTTKPDGTGLGLAICSRIIERHDGQLTSSSDGKSGALFQIILPVASATAGAE
jgi:signal transduction histidine kinase